MHGIPDPSQLFAGALAFLRISVILFALPIIGDPPTPVKARILTALALTFGLYNTLPANFAPRLDTDVLSMSAYVVREVLVGLVLGYLGRAAFDGMIMAANIVAYQMGFSTASLFVPDAGLQMDAFTAFHRLIVMLIFLALNLHHIFISAIAESFQLVPGGVAGMHGSLIQLLIQSSGAIFVIGVQLAAPLLVALMFTMAGLGLVARTVPQMNVFTMSFPVSFGIGLMVYIATFPFFPEWMQNHFLEERAGMLAALRGLVNG
jgi:flagellar biosynthetic protein FliR